MNFLFAAAVKPSDNFARSSTSSPLMKKPSPPSVLSETSRDPTFDVMMMTQLHNSLTGSFVPVVSVPLSSIPSKRFQSESLAFSISSNTRMANGNASDFKPISRALVNRGLVSL